MISRRLSRMREADPANRRSRLRTGARWVHRAIGAIPAIVGDAAATAILMVYTGIDRLTKGELTWLLNARGRWATFAREAAKISPRADVYHGHDLSAIGAAMSSRDRHGAGAIVYDVHELYVESGSLAARSRGLKRILRRREAGCYRRADAVVTVNASIARELGHRYGEREIAVIHNAVRVRTEPRGDLLRKALGIPATEAVALYQGALSEVRGLRQMIAAFETPGLARAHLVFMGFGPMRDELAAITSGRPRVHLVEPVRPHELDAWVASADVSLMTNLPAGMNEILSTPNKLFESIAAGVPVVTSDFPERRAIVMDPVLGPLGEVCDPESPRSIAAAVTSILTAGSAERAALRDRCIRASERRWNWDRQEMTLLRVYGSLSQPSPETLAYSGMAVSG